MKYLEIVAFLQSKWNSLNDEDKLSYELKSREYEKKLDNIIKKANATVETASARVHMKPKEIPTEDVVMNEESDEPK